MLRDISKPVLSMAFHFYAKALAFPYDEMTHEFQYIFREMEKYCETEYDQAVTSKVLDTINFYQGEEQLDLHGEYSRLFSYIENEEPRVQVNAQNYDENIDSETLYDLFADSGLLFDFSEDIDNFQNLMDYFSFLINTAMEDEEIIRFYLNYLKNNLIQFCDNLSRATTLNFYKEYSRSLAELLNLIEE